MPEPTDLSRLTSGEARLRLKSLQRILAGLPDDDPDKEFGLALVDHLAALAEGSFEFVQRMKLAVEGLPQNHQGKEFLRAELDDYLFSSRPFQNEIRNRLHKALINKPPEPEKKRRVTVERIADIEAECPEGYE